MTEVIKFGKLYWEDLQTGKATNTDTVVLADGSSPTLHHIDFQPGWVNLLDPKFGVDNTGVTSATAGIRKAVKQAISDKTGVFCGNGIFLLTDIGYPELIPVTDGLKFVGSGGSATQFLIDASVGATKDVFHVQQNSRGMYLFSDFNVKPVSGTPARHLFNLDSDLPGGGAGSGPEIITIQRIAQTYDLGGYSVATTGATPTSAYITGLNIIGNFFGSGMNLGGGYITDIPLIRDNSFLGGASGVGPGSSTKGITISMYGSSTLEFVHNHCARLAGGLHLVDCGFARIENNDFELVIPSSSGYLLWIQATISNGADFPWIRNNNFNTFGDTTVSKVIRIAGAGSVNVNGGRIEDNNIVTPTGKIGISIESGTVGLTIGRNDFSGDTTNAIVNGGSGIRFLHNTGPSATPTSVADANFMQPADNQRGVQIYRKSASATEAVLAITTETGVMMAGAYANGDWKTGMLTHGQCLVEHTWEEEVTVLAGATTDTTTKIPAGALVVYVSPYVVTTIPTAATFTLTGVTTGTFTGSVSTAGGASDPGTLAGMFYSATTQSVRITPNTSPAAATGVVRITAHYFTVTVATS
jgi:hypothetical protein